MISGSIATHGYILGAIALVAAIVLVVLLVRVFVKRR